MSRIHWDKKLSVNICKIDDQHKQLIKMINQLEDAAANGGWTRKVVILSDVMLELTDYLQYHFSTEEKYMIDYSYPDFQTHQEQHQKFVQEVVTFTEEFRTGKEGLSDDILGFLKEWFLNHIATVDMQFGAFLGGKGMG